MGQSISGILSFFGGGSKQDPSHADDDEDTIPGMCLTHKHLQHVPREDVPEATRRYKKCPARSFKAARPGLTGLSGVSDERNCLSKVQKA